MTLDYLVADPSGNTTILVLTPVPKEQHSSLAAQLLALPGIEAEQVGYVSREAGKPLRDARGEFLGALAHEVGGLKDDLVALVGREPDLTESLLGRVDGRTAFRLACDGNLGNGFVRLFIVDRDGLLGHDFLTADVQGLFFHGNTS